MMGYGFTIGKDHALRVKEQRSYPWPAPNAAPPDFSRKIELFTDDVLTKSPDGTYMKHTGLGCFGIVLRDDEVEPWPCDKHLRLL